MFRVFTATCGALALACAIVPAAFLAAQSPPGADAPPPPVVPANPANMGPDRPAADMQQVLDVLASLGGRPIETLTPAQARVQPTPADAVMRIMQQRGIPADTSVATEERSYGADPWQKVRIYHPPGHRAGGSPLPAVVYFHGGGWVIANLDVYDATPRAMAKSLNAIVVSVEYRHAPETKFPGQHEDAAMAWNWVHQNADALGIDHGRIAVAGESAGGNLAVATAIHARDNRLPMPVHVLAVYPIADSRKDLPSRIDSAAAKPLNTPMLSWFGHYYMRSPSEANDPRLNLVGANLGGLPPVTIVNASIDPLRSDGENLAAALRSAGNNVAQRTFPGVTHEFFGMGSVVAGAKAAQDWAFMRMGPKLNPGERG